MVAKADQRAAHSIPRSERGVWMCDILRSNYDGAITATVNFIARILEPLGKPPNSVYRDP